MKLKNYAILLSFLLGGSAFVKAQDIALKSNILYDASGTINLGAEVGLAPRWTLDVSGNYNGWVRSHGRTWKHWMLQPEARYWFCDRFTGHFVGVHAHGGQYNVGNLKNDISFLGSDLSGCFLVHICVFYSSHSSYFAFLCTSSKIFRAKMEPSINLFFMSFSNY